MLPPWSKPLDVDRLSRGAAEIDFEVPLAELARLVSRIAGIGGSVHGTARFGREADTPTVELALKGHATLQCQRCMQPMELAIESATHLALIGAEADAATAPDELEPVLAPEGRVSVGELVEEELLLALPIVPRHPLLAQCGVAAEAPLVGEDEPEQVMQRPFARLAELLRHK